MPEPSSLLALDFNDPEADLEILTNYSGMLENEWNCQVCTMRNHYVVGKLSSAKCTVCGYKNATIEEVLIGLGKQKHGEKEGEFYLCKICNTFSIH